MRVVTFLICLLFVSSAFANNCSTDLVNQRYVTNKGRSGSLEKMGKLICRESTQEEISCAKNIVDKRYIVEKGRYYNRISVAIELCQENSPETLDCAANLVDEGYIEDKGRYYNNINMGIYICKQEGLAKVLCAKEKLKKSNVSKVIARSWLVVKKYRNSISAAAKLCGEEDLTPVDENSRPLEEASVDGSSRFKENNFSEERYNENKSQNQIGYSK